MLFSEPPDERGSSVDVFDASGKRVDAGRTTPSGDENGLRVGLTAIGDGGYVVSWTVLSGVDGHTTRGSFAFAVGDAPLPKIADVSDVAPPPTALEVAARALSFAGIAMAIGLAAVGLVIREPLAAPRSREWLIAAIAGALIVIGSVALLLEQGGRAPPRLTALLGLRGLAGVALLVAAGVLAGRRLSLAALAAGAVAAITATLVSHAAATGSIGQMALDFTHIVSVSAWSGGVVAMFALVIPALADARVLGSATWRFSLLALTAVSVLAVSGLLQAFDRLVLLQDLVETPYGVALLIKSGVLVAVLGLAVINLFFWGPRLRAVVDPVRARRGLLLGTAGESMLLAVIFVAAGSLTALPFPGQPSGAAFDQTLHVDGLRLRLLMPSISPGQNRYVLRVHRGLDQVTDARVLFRFTMLEHDMGESELEAEQRAPGEYAAAGSATVMFGTWRVEAIVRRPDRDDVRTIFSVPIGQPTGPGAIARALQAGPYTLIVFVDPPQPIAGAPLALNVVVVDASGDPVTAKEVRAELNGPAPAGVLPCAERSRLASAGAARGQEASPGRYVLPIAALEAGRWAATISVGGDGSACYDFEVVR